MLVSLGCSSLKYSDVHPQCQDERCLKKTVTEKCNIMLFTSVKSLPLPLKEVKVKEY